MLGVQAKARVACIHARMPAELRRKHERRRQGEKRMNGEERYR